MPADRLERLPDTGFYVAVIDHQRGTAAIRNAPANLHRLAVATPFKDRARARRTGLCRQQGLEKWQRLGGDREGRLSLSLILIRRSGQPRARLIAWVAGCQAKESIARINASPSGQA